MTIHINTLADLPAAAKDFLQAIGDSRIIVFYGEMGAGKTTFIKALCDVLQVDDVVNSPTFAIVNEYCSRLLGEPVYHFDFYRIRRQSEVIDLGFEDYLSSGYLCLMEWPELVEELLPDDTLRVRLRELPDGKRELKVES